MALPDWYSIKAELTREIKKELARDQITYEEYSRLYLNAFPAPTPPGEKLPDWIIPFFHPYENEVRTATQIRVHQDPSLMLTVITALLPDGRTISTRISDLLLESISLDTSFLDQFATSLALPTVVSQYPILGWRIWLPREDTMYGYYNKPWASPLLEATCSHNTPPPHEGLRMRCGIYLLKEPDVFSDLTRVSEYIVGLAVAERVIEHEYGYRAGLVRCIALSGPTTAPGWDGIPIMSYKELGEYEQFLRSNPESIPYPDDLPAP